MVNVVCLKFGTLYGPEYVNRLYYAVHRNATVPFNFHCFTENSQGIDPAITIHTLPHKHIDGWWHKLYLFHADKQIGGRIIYFDLDTLITGNVDDILQQDEGFVVLHDFFRIMQPNRVDKFGSGKEAVGSGVLSWNAGEHSHIWDTFAANPSQAIASLKPHGDQKWIERQQKERLYWQDLFPKQFVSFKVHCSKGLAPNARVVCYHGKPSIPESISTTTKVQGYIIPPASWVKEHWKDEI